jgi:hypothetical protein
VQWIDLAQDTNQWRAIVNMVMGTDKCAQSITDSTSRFLATNFNAGIITISLNDTLQISHLKSSL